MSLEREPNADEMIFVPQAKAATDMAALFPLAEILSHRKRMQAEERKTFAKSATGDDSAARRILLRAERTEQDLWQQYTKLAMDNPDLYRALFAQEEDR